MIATAPIARPAMAPLDIPLDEELLVGTGEGCEAVVVAGLVEEVLVVLVVLLEVAFDCTRASGMLHRTFEVWFPGAHVVSCGQQACLTPSARWGQWTAPGAEQSDGRST